MEVPVTDGVDADEKEKVDKAVLDSPTVRRGVLLAEDVTLPVSVTAILVVKVEPCDLSEVSEADTLGLRNDEEDVDAVKVSTAVTLAVDDIEATVALPDEETLRVNSGVTETDEDDVTNRTGDDVAVTHEDVERVFILFDDVTVPETQNDRERTGLADGDRE